MACSTHAASAHGAGREFDVSFRQHYSNRWDVKQVSPWMGSLGRTVFGLF